MPYNVGMHRPTIPASALKPMAQIPSAASSPTYWFDDGAAYVMPSPQYPNQVIGFDSYASLQKYVGKTAFTALADPKLYESQPFSATDFPVMIYGLFKKACWVFVSQFTAPMATAFMANFFSGPVPALKTYLSWTQAQSVSVISAAGPSTVTLKYLPLTGIPASLTPYAVTSDPVLGVLQP